MAEKSLLNTNSAKHFALGRTSVKGILRAWPVAANLSVTALGEAGG